MTRSSAAWRTAWAAGMLEQEDTHCQCHLQGKKVMAGTLSHK